MKKYISILSILLLAQLLSVCTWAQTQEMSFDFGGAQVSINTSKNKPVFFSNPFTAEKIEAFHQAAGNSGLDNIARQLLQYKADWQLDDWFYYQLIRKTAQALSPKAENYERYTLYKWYLLQQSGYDAIIRISNKYMLLYVNSTANIYNIPTVNTGGKQFICLNYHDYGAIDFRQSLLKDVAITTDNPKKEFSYTITKIPGFNSNNYEEKDLAFTYNDNNYHFRIKVSKQINGFFTNYPATDYSAYFNTPLSTETHRSLIPLLRAQLKGKSTKEGVAYLMHFTRYAFVFETDTDQFGKEKRLLPEQTLFYSKSDCEDRAALFFCLVKEIYNLPMIVLSYPNHVTIAVKFDKAHGNPIMYNGEKYYVCEPTSQRKDLAIGEVSKNLRKASFEIAYAYKPGN